jgi:hypothetical protein
MSDVPDYISQLPSPDDDALWKHIGERFSELSDVVTLTCLETREAALGQEPLWVSNTPLWHSPELGPDKAGNDIKVRPWLLIPYIGAVDQELLEKRFAEAALMVPGVGAGISRRELTPQFMLKWGIFCELAGSVELIFLSHPDNMHAQRISKLRSVEPQRKWVAVQLLELWSRGVKGKAAETHIFLKVEEILRNKGFSPQFGAAWYQSLIVETRDGRKLRSTYCTAGKFLKADVERFKDADLKGIPPLPAPTPL